MTTEHLFIIDPLSTLNLALDSSLRMMFELARQGDGIRVAEARDLTWRSSDQGAGVACRRLTFGRSPTDFVAGSTEQLSLSAFTAVHMRKDPPYDIEYVMVTWLLDSAGVRVYNDPEALRRYNEKLAILRFPAECRPAFVSASAEALLEFIADEAGGDAVVKPLTLFGGRGVERLQLAKLSRAEALTSLQVATSNGQSMRLVQAFDPAVFAGEVRVFTAFGTPLAWCLKRPAEGQFLANTRAGAKLERYDPPKAEVQRVVRVAKALQTDGVALIGFDLIGGYISEINITSPRLLQAPQDAENYYEVFAKLVAIDLEV